MIGVNLTSDALLRQLESELPKQPFHPRLAIIRVGDDKLSETFVNLKLKKAQKYGVDAQEYAFPASTSALDLVQSMNTLQSRRGLSGLVLQLPLPEELTSHRDQILEAIQPEFDVDALTSRNEFFVSPMVQAVGELERYYGLDFTSKKIVIVGHGVLVGRPLEAWLRKRGLNPVIVDKDTTPDEASKQIKEADVILAGTNDPHTINARNTREGQIVFDCSGHSVDYERVAQKARFITPPKGSIGPLTVHFLLANTLRSAQR